MLCRLLEYTLYMYSRDKRRFLRDTRNSFSVLTFLKEFDLSFETLLVVMSGERNTHDTTTGRLQ